MAAPNEITVPQLLRLIGTPDAPVIVDISIDPDFADDPFLIPGAFRHPHTDFAGLLARLAGRPCVVTCQQGIKLSQGLVAKLRAKGVQAEYLKGGNRPARASGWAYALGHPPPPQNRPHRLSLADPALCGPRCAIPVRLPRRSAGRSRAVQCHTV